MSKSRVYKYDTFSYFSYGSNMFSFRIHMNNPTAEFVSIGRLDNFRLDFIRYSKFWGGPTATIVPTANAQVWGVIWRLHVDNIMSLDEQEGVDKQLYYVKHLKVLTPYIGEILCRVYIQTVNPLPLGDNDSIPVERWPSWTYKEILIIGALEHNLPKHYIEMLEKIKDNGEKGFFRVCCILRRYARHDPCLCRVPGRIPRKPLKLDLRSKRNTKAQNAQKK